MLQNLSMDDYFMTASVAVGIFAILLIWIYLWEAARGIHITEFDTYKKYVNSPYAFSVIMLVVLWITTTDMDEKLMNCVWILTAGWLITAIASLIVSAVVRSKLNDKKTMREAVLPCISKVIIMAVVFWLVY